jgi:hypothetical protein
MIPAAVAILTVAAVAAFCLRSHKGDHDAEGY